MTDAARAAFEAHAEGYDAERRRLLPCFDAFYAAAVEAVGLSGRPPGRVLDLGAGTGLLAGFVAEAFPAARLTLLDGAGAMLAQARERLGERASYVVGDLADPLPEGPWDAIVSALAIHHLDDPGKRDLFARVRAALAPGGLFVNAEQVSRARPRGSTPSTSSATSAPRAPWAPPRPSGRRPPSAWAMTCARRSRTSSRGCATRGSPMRAACGATGASRCWWRGPDRAGLAAA